MKKSLERSAAAILRNRRRGTFGGGATRAAFASAPFSRTVRDGDRPGKTTDAFRTLRCRRGFSSKSSSSSSAEVSDRGGAIIPAFSSRGDAASIHLPPADDPVGLGLYKKAIYCPITRTLRTSAHVGSDDANRKADGVVGDTVSTEDARNHARNSGLRLLATVRDFLDGDLGRVEQVLHLRGLVKAAPGFSGHAGVIDGCSEVLAEAFGPDAGVGTRECFGIGSLGSTVACVLELRVRPPPPPE